MMPPSSWTGQVEVVCLSLAAAPCGAKYAKPGRCFSPRHCSPCLLQFPSWRALASPVAASSAEQLLTLNLLAPSTQVLLELSLWSGHLDKGKERGETVDGRWNGKEKLKTVFGMLRDPPCGDGIMRWDGRNAWPSRSRVSIPPVDSRISIGNKWEMRGGGICSNGFLLHNIIYQTLSLWASSKTELVNL